MKTIFIDADFKCHTENLNDNFREIKTDFFDGKCDVFIKGYRFVPYGESWIRLDGEVFCGEMIAPWKPYSELDNAQQEYEKQLLTEYQNKENSLITSYTEGVNSI